MLVIKGMVHVAYDVILLHSQEIFSSAAHSFLTPELNCTLICMKTDKMKDVQYLYKTLSLLSIIYCIILHME